MIFIRQFKSTLLTVFLLFKRPQALGLEKAPFWFILRNSDLLTCELFSTKSIMSLTQFSSAISQITSVTAAWVPFLAFMHIIFQIRFSLSVKRILKVFVSFLTLLNKIFICVEDSDALPIPVLRYRLVPSKNINNG